jgi:hypothetical protein
MSLSRNNLVKNKSVSTAFGFTCLLVSAIPVQAVPAVPIEKQVKDVYAVTASSSDSFISNFEIPVEVSNG